MRLGRSIFGASFGRSDKVGPRDIFQSLWRAPRAIDARWLRVYFGPNKVYGLALFLFGWRLAFALQTDPAGGGAYARSRVEAIDMVHEGPPEPDFHDEWARLREQDEAAQICSGQSRLEWWRDHWRRDRKWIER